MKLFTVHLFNTPAGSNNSEEDERITFYRNPNFPFDITEVIYEPSTGPTTYRFWLTRQSLDHYVQDLLQSLSQDICPFDHFQLSPSNGPAILYEVAQLEEPQVRRSIISTINTLALLEIVAEPREEAE